MQWFPKFGWDKKKTTWLLLLVIIPLYPLVLSQGSASWMPLLLHTPMQMPLEVNSLTYPSNHSHWHFLPNVMYSSGLDDLRDWTNNVQDNGIPVFVTKRDFEVIFFFLQILSEKLNLYISSLFRWCRKLITTLWTPVTSLLVQLCQP